MVVVRPAADGGRGVAVLAEHVRPVGDRRHVVELLRAQVVAVDLPAAGRAGRGRPPEHDVADLLLAAEHGLPGCARELADAVPPLAVVVQQRQPIEVGRSLEELLDHRHLGLPIRHGPDSGASCTGGPRVTPLSVMENGTTSSTGLFYDHASIDYPILDCDAHVNEPPDTWVGRVPAKFKDRAPKVVHTRRGRLLVVRRRREHAPGRSHRHRRAVLPRLRARRRQLRDHAARLLRHQGPPRRHGRRRDLPPGAVPERHARSAPRSTATSPSSRCVRARVQRLARRVLRGLRRPPHRPGHPADHGRRRHAIAETEAGARPRAPRRRDLRVSRTARSTPEARGRPRSGRSRRRPTSRSPCTSAASCRRPAAERAGRST